MILIMNLSMNNSYYSKSLLLTSAPSAATMRTDPRSSGTNVGLRKLLAVPTMNSSVNTCYYSECLLTFALSAATMRTDWRTSGMNVGPKSCLQYPQWIHKWIIISTLKVFINFCKWYPNNKKALTMNSTMTKQIYFLVNSYLQVVNPRSTLIRSDSKSSRMNNRLKSLEPKKLPST